MFSTPYPEGDFAPPPGTPDEQIVRSVGRRLMSGLGGGSGRITVTSLNRVVVLEGTVDSATIARRAAALARRTPEVFDVCNALTYPTADAGQSW